MAMVYSIGVPLVVVLTNLGRSPDNGFDIILFMMPDRYRPPIGRETGIALTSEKKSRDDSVGNRPEEARVQNYEPANRNGNKAESPDKSMRKSIG